MDPRIDRLRGLLAIGVLLGHVIDLSLIASRDGSGIIYGIAAAARPYFGFICVVGFIVLSGYCITRSTLKGFSLGHYTVRRITRLYPLLLVVVLPSGLMELLMLNSQHRPDMWAGNVDVTSFFYAVGGLSGFRAPFGALAPSYTISYELMYYAVWGLAMALAFGRPRIGLLVATGVAALLLVKGDAIRLALGGYAGFAHPLAIALLPAWLLGAALALYQRPVSVVMGRVPAWILWIVMFLAFGWAHDTFQKPVVVPIDFTDVIYYTAMSLLLVLTLASWLSRPARENATDTWLGELSYPLFLAHGPAIIGTAYVLNRIGPKANFEGTAVILIGSAVLVASILAICVERPLMAWRRRDRGPAPSPRLSPALEV